MLWNMGGSPMCQGQQTHAYEKNFTLQCVEGNDHYNLHFSHENMESYRESKGDGIDFEWHDNL